MSKYVKTDTILDKILAYKVEEIEISKKHATEDVLRDLSSRVSKPRKFLEALRRDTVALIAEVKKASPSKGVFLEDFDHIGLAQIYAENGAAAISVLTDQKFFQGHLYFLEEVNQNVSVPTLRKDFIIDSYQVYQARIARADAVLLIVAALEDSQMADLHAMITELRMAALVEVHNEAELERAMRIGAWLIGINNRDLKTFKVDLGTTERIAKLVPEDITLVAESGLKTVDDIAKMGQMGAHAVLIGEGLVTANNIAETVSAFSRQIRG
jgi:indole-3-glycerol phosphate synthase